MLVCVCARLGWCGACCLVLCCAVCAVCCVCCADLMRGRTARHAISVTRVCVCVWLCRFDKCVCVCVCVVCSVCGVCVCAWAQVLCVPQVLVSVCVRVCVRVKCFHGRAAVPDHFRAWSVVCEFAGVLPPRYTKHMPQFSSPCCNCLRWSHLRHLGCV